ncbi:hypothetical protein HID58_034142 [Brassica napus]|uniref:Uncharacterized protein n=1 Tax=Brassica napus TaxID=3708 RepID=A0ABQ8C337_BRANA|nr:hypothetical protein HID58_034142 [Brassica napus]
MKNVSSLSAFSHSFIGASVHLPLSNARETIVAFRSSILRGSWQLKLLGFYILSKVECEESFMSEQASLFQSSIQLLGEYCPTSRKKSTRLGSSFEALNNTSSSSVQYLCLF